MKALFLLQQTITDTASAIPTIPAQPEIKELDIIGLVFDPAGLWVMIPLFLMVAYSIYVFIERWLTLNNAAKEEPNFMNNIKDFIHNGKIESAVALCKGNDTSLARMIEKGLTRIGKPLEDISAAIENTGKLEVARLEKGLNVLGTITSVAPMLGFLGTVMGMVVTFHAMESNPNNLNVSQLAGGIYTAMVTTIAGLIVAIIAHVFYNFLVSKVSRMVNMLETRATEFMDLLHEPV